MKSLELSLEFGQGNPSLFDLIWCFRNIGGMMTKLGKLSNIIIKQQSSMVVLTHTHTHTELLHHILLVWMSNWEDRFTRRGNRMLPGANKLPHESWFQGQWSLIAPGQTWPRKPSDFHLLSPFCWGISTPRCWSTFGRDTEISRRQHGWKMHCAWPRMV